MPTPRHAGYDVLAVDPPWPKKKGGVRAVRPNQGRELDYATMSVPDVFALLDAQVFPQAAPAHVAFLWGVEQFLRDGEDEMCRRGYRLHCRLVWDKCNGVAPAFSVRFAHEYVSWFYLGAFRPVDRSARGKLTTVLREPAREHSRKPEAFYDAVQLWFPTARKLDVFSRQPRPGWDQFGDQTGHFGDSQ